MANRMESDTTRSASFNDDELVSNSDDGKNILEVTTSRRFPLLSDASLVRRICTLLSLALAVFIASLDQTIVATSMPSIAEHFDSFSSVNWIAASFLLASTALQPLYGRLSDIFGRIETLMLGLSVFLLGSAISGAATSITILIAGRSVQGLGAGSLISITMVIISDITIERDRSKYASVFSSVWALSSVLGPLLGGAFTESSAGWRWVFYFSVPVGVAAGVAILVFVRLPRPRGSLSQKLAHIDFIGTAVLVTGIMLVLLGLNFGGREYAWSSATVVCLLVFGALVIGGFVLVERHVSKEPIMPMRLFKSRNVGLILVMSLFTGGALLGPTFYIPIYFNVVDNASAIIAGVHLMPFMLGTNIFAILCSYITSWTGRYREQMWVGGTISTLGLGLLALLDEHTSTGKGLCIITISGIGVGMCMQTSLIGIQAAAQPRDMATVTAIYISLRTLGGTIGLVIFQTVLQISLTPKMDRLMATFPEFASSIAAAIDNQAIIYDSGLPGELQKAMTSAYTDSLRTVFYTMVPFGGSMLVCAALCRHIPLRTQMKSTVLE